VIPHLGDLPLNAITIEAVQRLKGALAAKSPKTVNNALTVLNVLLKTAGSWNVIDRMPCTIRLLRVTTGSAAFLDFEEYKRLLDAARRDGPRAHVITLLGGDGGLRCGEMMALEWTDVDFAKRQLCVARSEWKGHVPRPRAAGCAMCR
jgi:integrase